MPFSKHAYHDKPSYIQEISYNEHKELDAYEYTLYENAHKTFPLKYANSAF